MNDCGDANLETHRRKSQCFNPQLGPDRCMVGHVLAVQFDDRVVDDRRKATDMVCINVNNVIPGRPGLRQNELDIAEGGGNLLLDGLRDLQVIVPTTLTGCLHPVSDLDSGREMQRLAERLAEPGCDGEFRLFHYVSPKKLSASTRLSIATRQWHYRNAVPFIIGWLSGVWMSVWSTG